ncbi:MAG: nucleotidyltransferase domain-containing protein [Burkholderiales bacterium]|nr:nucleotidyltransferase domain-containing protein [Burkholderiales bacterium]MDE2627588.1 nucleotidyltransferase domain-containing protein [Burkholderiales bacterium]
MRVDAVNVVRAVVLTPDQVRAVCAIVDRVIPGAQVRVFGSRATGRARPFSDLDLLFVQPARLSWEQRADLRDRFEASELPFRVDVVEAEGLPRGMAERVAGESVSLRDL